MNWYGYVYKTINLLNGKIYIGRRKGPFNRAYHGSGIILKRAVALHGASNFLTEVLSWAADFNELCALEIQHIRAFRQSLPTDMLYNISDGGLGGNTGHPASEETRRLMSEAKRGEKNNMYGVHLTGELNPMWGRNHSEETKKKMRKEHRISTSHPAGWKHGNYGKVRSKEIRRKISEAKKGLVSTFKGHHHSEKARAKLSLAAIMRTGARNPFFGHHHSPETKAKISASKTRMVIS